MYKINEASDLLEVSRVELFEVLLSQREVFGPLTSKVNGVTLISKEAIDLIRKIINEKNGILSVDTEEKPSAFIKGEALYHQERNETTKITEFSENIGNEAIPSIDGNMIKGYSPDDTDLFVEEKRAILENEFDDQSLLEIRQKIRLLRNQILTIDSELKRKEDAISHYQQILSDDLNWIEAYENDLYDYIESLSNPLSSPKEFEPLEDPKAGFKKFFKK